MGAFFSLQCSLQASPSVSTRSFCESILFVRLEALRGSEQRVVRIVGMVGLSLDATRANALATSTGRRLVMKRTWSRSRGTRLAPSTASSACLIRYDCTVILTVNVLSSVLEV